MYKMLCLLAWIFNWELVMLTDFDGEFVVKKVHYIGTLRCAWRFWSVARVVLMDDGTTKGVIYVREWKLLRARKN